MQLSGMLAIAKMFRARYFAIKSQRKKERERGMRKRRTET
jgi:hypothetical protein